MSRYVNCLKCGIALAANSPSEVVYCSRCAAAEYRRARKGDWGGVATGVAVVGSAAVGTLLVSALLKALFGGK